MKEKIKPKNFMDDNAMKKVFKVRELGKEIEIIDLEDFDNFISLSVMKRGFCINKQLTN